MIVADAGYGVERVRHSREDGNPAVARHANELDASLRWHDQGDTAYGEPEVFPFGDADGDYQVHATIDLAAITAIKDGQAPYNILADLNLDGAVTQADLNAFSAYSGALGGRNVLTSSNGSATTGNDIGYAGYTWNDERSQWHVRHREYDPKLGRWLQRDPAGYVAGTNLYTYVLSSPLSLIDPFGLQPKDKLYGHPPACWSWYEKNRKRRFDPDLTKEQADELVREWQDLGKPPADKKGLHRGRQRHGITTPSGVVIAAGSAILAAIVGDFIDALGAFPEDPICQALVKGIAKGNCDIIDRLGVDCCTNVAAIGFVTYQNCVDFMEALHRKCRAATAKCEDFGTEDYPTSPIPPEPSGFGPPVELPHDAWGGIQNPPLYWPVPANYEPPLVIPYAPPPLPPRI